MFPKKSISSIIMSGAFVLSFGLPLGGELAAEQPPAGFLRMERELEALAPELMRKHGVVGAQIHLFGDAAGAADRSLVFGHRDAQREQLVTPDTLFQAADLVRPVTAYLLLDLLETQRRAAGAGDFATAVNRRLAALAEFPVQGAEDSSDSDATLAPFSAYELLTMASGLPASRDGLIRGELERPDAKAYLRERLALTHAPGELFAISPEAYAYAGEYLSQQSGEGFDARAPRILRERFGIRTACIERTQCSEAATLADGTVHSGKYVFPLDPPHVLYPSADSLWISAGDYGRFLKQVVRRSTGGDPAAAGLFQPLRRSAPGLGGHSMGFQALRGQQSVALYSVEGRQPGFASYAFVTPGGRGAVLLCNSNERFFIREMVSYLYDRFALLEKNPPSVDAKALDAARQLEGSYRARATVPARESLFSFLTDVRIQVGARRIDFGGVFQKDAGVQLYPLESAQPDLYLARGAVTMDGWRVKVRRDSDGDIVGLDSDLVRYDRVHPLASAWAILMYLGMLTSIPVLLFMLFIIRRRSDRTT